MDKFNNTIKNYQERIGTPLTGKKGTGKTEHTMELIKGVFNGLCNRTACQSRRAVFYNWSTQKYYCPACAKLINDGNHADAIRLYGHELCTVGEHLESQGKLNIFMTRPGFYDAVITTAEEIDRPYDRKFTVELYKAQKWEQVNYAGPMGTTGVLADKYNDDGFYYIRTPWNYMHADDPYMFRAIPKEWVSEKPLELNLENGAYCFTQYN